MYCFTVKCVKHIGQTMYFLCPVIVLVALPTNCSKNACFRFQKLSSEYKKKFFLEIIISDSDELTL